MIKKNNLFILKWIVTLILVIFFIRYVDNADTTIIRKATVEKIENGIIEMTDKNGNIWLWEEEEKDFFKGQKVKLIMNNNHTEDTIEDDIIIKIKPL